MMLSKAIFTFLSIRLKEHFKLSNPKIGKLYISFPKRPRMIIPNNIGKKFNKIIIIIK